MAKGKFFCFGALFFFIAMKLLWVLLPTFSMGLPRLGDDALVYLWSGASSVVSPQNNSTAIKDVMALRSKLDNPSSELDYARARVTMRVAGVSASPYAIAMGAFFKSGASLKVTFAIFEALISIILAASLCYFLKQFFGYGSAAVSLFLLSFTVLPNQGIHYLIPSVLSLSLALVLWTVVLKDQKKIIIIALLTALMMLIHTIGQVYVLMAFLVVIAQAMFTRQLNSSVWKVMLALMLGVLLWWLVNRFGGAVPAKTTGMGGFAVSKFMENLEGFSGVLLKFLSTQYLIAVLSIIGFGVLLNKRKNVDISILLTVITVSMISAALIDLPGYPAELSSRLLVSFIIICLGGASVWVWNWLVPVALSWGRVLSFIVVVIIMQTPYLIDYFYTNLNSRHQIVNEGLFAKQMNALPRGASIIWLDTDTLMMYGLLYGGSKYHFIPYSMLGGIDELKEATHKADNLYLSSAYPERLNGTSSLGLHKLARRFYGYGFDDYKQVTVAGLKQRDSLYIKVTGGNLNDLLVTNQDHLSCSIYPRVINAEDALWLKVVGCESASELTFQSKNPSLSLLGISSGLPVEGVSWPWGNANLALRAEPWDKTKEGPNVRFDLKSVLAVPNIESLQERFQFKLISDAAGQILFKLEFES